VALNTPVGKRPTRPKDKDAEWQTVPRKGEKSKSGGSQVLWVHVKENIHPAAWKAKKKRLTPIPTNLTRMLHGLRTPTG
jgi:hypothetical protein